MLNTQSMTPQQLYEAQALIEQRIQSQGTITSADSTELDQIQAEIDRRVAVEQLAKVTSEEVDGTTGVQNRVS